ncbi:MAG: hypothetical protein OJF51_002480 [Nitrospira sp.]|nr:MAG: hypothetical protein OJF51_002480 [Nitrospira sp.]
MGERRVGQLLLEVAVKVSLFHPLVLSCQSRILVMGHLQAPPAECSAPASAGRPSQSK